MIYNNNFQFAELTQKSSKVKKSACLRQKNINFIKAL